MLRVVLAHVKFAAMMPKGFWVVARVLLLDLAKIQNLTTGSQPIRELEHELNWQFIAIGPFAELQFELEWQKGS